MRDRSVEMPATGGRKKGPRPLGGVGLGQCVVAAALPAPQELSIRGAYFLHSALVSFSFLLQSTFLSSILPPPWLPAMAGEAARTKAAAIAEIRVFMVYLLQKAVTRKTTQNARNPTFQPERTLLHPTLLTRSEPRSLGKVSRRATGTPALRLVAGLVLVFSGVLAHGQARFLPAPDQVVLPASVHALGSQSVALREAEQAWRRAPDDIDKALDYARAVFVLGLTEGDLRWYGAARAALAPWWTAAVLPARGHYLRGLVRQGFHDFEGGLRDINAAIALDPAQPEFWSWRFSLHLLASDMVAADADCSEIGRRFGGDEGDACRATLLYRTGRAPQALPLFEALVRKSDYQGALAQGWLRFHQGEALRVAGQPERAAQVWEQHLKAHPRAHGVRLALAELYNEQRQPDRARRVADVKAPSDALLVQSLLASRALGDGDAERLAAQVEGRMKVQAERGEALIERPQMVYYIRTGRDLERGLALASRNWREQNEPADAVLLLEAVLQLKRPRAGEPVLRWMAQTGYTDPVLAPLARQLQDQLKGS